MKRAYTDFKKMGFLALIFSVVFITSCDKNDEPSTPDIRVAFSFSPENPKAGEEVTFTNASTGGTEYLWDFGDGGSSTDQSPTYTYETSDTYTVTLVVDGFVELAASEEIVVGDPQPVISYEPEAVAIGDEVTFSVEVYNPFEETITYSWDFGDVVTGDDVTDGMSTVASPVVVFTAEGETTVKVTATVGSVEYSDSTVVDVKGQLAKTLIFSVLDSLDSYNSGSLYKKKLYTGLDAEATDFNVPTGPHPLTVRVANQRVYVFEAGASLTYVAGDAAVPDGSIFSASLDNSTDYVTIMNFEGASGATNYHDPFWGDVTSSKIYFGNRRDGVTAIDVSTTNADYDLTDYPYFVVNADLGYYSGNRTDGGPTYGWGALNGSFHVRENNGVEEFWWAKNSNHKGLWRFTSTDIGVTDAVPSLGGILTSEAVRAFELDETNQKIYFSINKVNGSNAMGFYRANLDGTNVELIDDSSWHSEGGDDERTGITGIAVDAEGGYVYWGYRAPADADPETNPLEVNSVKRWKIDGTGEVEIFVSDVWVYGLAIDHRKN